MANLKNITEVPEVESLSGSEKVLLNVNGGAKQVNVGLIKPKVTKELVYGWNFSLDDEVSEILENIDNDDLLWITHPEANEDFEIVITTYASYKESGEDRVHLSDKLLTSFVKPHHFYLGGQTENITASSQPFVEGEADMFAYDPETDRDYGHFASISVLSGCHVDFDSGLDISVETGGILFMIANNCYFKSVKIYKITK